MISSPSVSTSAMPEMMIEDASVPTIALMRPTVVMKPLTMPSPRPERAPSMIASVGIHVRCEHRRDHSREREDRSDREVEAPGDEHERAADGHDPVRRVPVEDVEEVHLRQEHVALERQVDEDDDEADDDAVVPERGEPDADTAACEVEPGRRCVGRRAHAATSPVAKAACRTSFSVAVRPSNSATSRPLRITMIRWARPSTSSSSDEMSSTASPSAASAWMSS